MNGEPAKGGDPPSKKAPAFAVQSLGTASNWTAVVALITGILALYLLFTALGRVFALLQGRGEESPGMTATLAAVELAVTVLLLRLTASLGAYVLGIWKMGREEASVSQVEEALARQRKLWRRFATTAVIILVIEVVAAPMTILTTLDHVKQAREWDESDRRLRAELEAARSRKPPPGDEDGMEEPFRRPVRSPERGWDDFPPPRRETP